MTVLRKHRQRFSIIALIMMVIILVVAVTYFRSSITPPITHNDVKYTSLIFGIDNDGGNADVIIATMFDLGNHTINAVSIPRDTIVLVDGDIPRRAGLVLPSMVERYGNTQDALSATIDVFTGVLGFEVDFHFVVDMDAFVALVDAIGGVAFYVPVDMDYIDPFQDLIIRYQKGLHHLTGEQALGVVRYRLTYIDGDFGRIRTQQDFLASAAEQVLSNPPAISETAGIFSNHVGTDLRLGELIWLFGELIQVDAENLSFKTMPGNLYVADHMQHMLPATAEWLDVINEKLNPLQAEITEQMLNIAQ